jgi:hypothetical protein
MHPTDLSVHMASHTVELNTMVCNEELAGRSEADCCTLQLESWSVGKQDTSDCHDWMKILSPSVSKQGSDENAVPTAREQGDDTETSAKALKC